MLHDALTLEEVVDSEAALEFMKEATKLATATELEDIGERLEGKSRFFQELLAADRIGVLGEEDFARLTRRIFSLKRKGARLVKRNGIEALRGALERLVHGEGGPEARLDRFLGEVGGLEEPMILALATESLHFFDPGRYWLWTHWIWSPKSGAGALRLVVQDGVDLSGASAGEVYLNVGRATALVTRQGHVDGYTRLGRGLFGTDVFLACVYAVYMYTVFRVKLSQEFNRILPELPELVERVLGVHRQRGADGR